MISNMTEPYIRFSVATFKLQLKNAVQYWTDFKDHRTLHPLWEHSNPKWKRQFSIEIISKMTEPYILCGDIQIPIDRTSHLLLGHWNSTEKDSSILKWFQRSLTPTYFVGTFKIQLKKTIQYRKDLKDHKTLQPLRGHPKPNWKRQFIIEMITKMTEHYIVCGDIQLSTKKDSSVLKWLQRWQNITFFVGTFKFRLKKKQFSIEMISKITERYILCRDIQVSTEKKQFSIEMISKMTEPCIPCGDNQIPTEKSVQHRNHFKDQRTLHSLLGHSNPNWKTQNIIEMITKMTAPYILCWHIQVSIERSFHLSLGHLKSNCKKQFSIQMISKVTEPYIVCGDTQIPTEKDSSVLKWFQRSQNFTSFERRFRHQLKKTG